MRAKNKTMEINTRNSPMAMGLSFLVTLTAVTISEMSVLLLFNRFIYACEFTGLDSAYQAVYLKLSK